MTITWNTLKQKLLRLELGPYIRRRSLISPVPLASVISKIYEQTSLFFKFVIGQRSKNLKETEANQGFEACSNSEITCQEQCSAKNSKTGTVLAKFGKLGEETVRGEEISASEFEFSQVSRNHPIDLNCADLNAQSTTKQWSNNFVVDYDLACTDRFSYRDVSKSTAFSELCSPSENRASEFEYWKIEFSHYTPSLLLDSGNQISKRSAGETASTAYSLTHLYMKEFSSSTSPTDTVTAKCVEDESSNQSEFVEFEDEEDEGSSQMPRRRQRREAVLSNYAAKYSSTTEDDDEPVGEKPLETVDSMGEADDDGAGTSATQQNYLPEEPTGAGGGAASGSGRERESERGGAVEGRGTGGNGGGGDFGGVNGAGGGGGAGDPNQEVPRVVNVYVNGDLYDVIHDMNGIGRFTDLIWRIFEILHSVDTGDFIFYGYTMNFMRVVQGPNGNNEESEELFPVGSLVGDPAWTIVWEEFSTKLTDISVLGIPRIFYSEDGILKPMPCHLLPRYNPAANGIWLLPQVPEKVALIVNDTLLTFFDTIHIPNLSMLFVQIYTLLHRHYEYWEYLRGYGFDIYYMSQSLNSELFPPIWSVLDQWPSFLNRLSEIQVYGRVDIFTRLDHERGRLSRAATGNLHEYVTINGRRRGYLARGRRPPGP